MENNPELAELKKRSVENIREPEERAAFTLRQEPEVTVLKVSNEQADPVTSAALVPLHNQENSNTGTLAEKPAESSQLTAKIEEVEAEPLFDRSAPFILYLDKAKARRAMAIPMIFTILFGLAFMALSSRLPLPAFVYLPLLVPIIMSVSSFIGYTRQRKAIFTVDNEGITLNMPLLNIGRVKWEEISSVEVINRGALRSIRLNVLDQSKVLARCDQHSKILAALISNPFEMSGQLLPISADELLEHIAAYAESYAKNVKIFRTGAQSGDQNLNEKSRWKKQALLLSASGIAILALFFFSSQTLLNDHHKTLENNLLSDLKQGDLYGGMRDKARLLAFEQKHKEALTAYMNYYDQSRADPSQSGVRNSFVTLEIVELGKAFPPALDALRQRRDERERKIFANSADKNDIKEWYSINQHLEESSRTAEVLLKLQKDKAPATALVLSVVSKYSQ